MLNTVADQLADGAGCGAPLASILFRGCRTLFVEPAGLQWMSLGHRICEVSCDRFGMDESHSLQCRTKSGRANLCQASRLRRWRVIGGGFRVCHGALSTAAADPSANRPRSYALVPKQHPGTHHTFSGFQHLAKFLWGVEKDFGGVRVFRPH